MKYNIRLLTLFILLVGNYNICLGFDRKARKSLVGFKGSARFDGAPGKSNYRVDEDHGSYVLVYVDGLGYERLPYSRTMGGYTHTYRAQTNYFCPHHYKTTLIIRTEKKDKCSHCGK